MALLLVKTDLESSTIQFLLVAITIAQLSNSILSNNYN